MSAISIELSQIPQSLLIIYDMSLSAELAQCQERFRKTVPRGIRDIVKTSISDFEASFLRGYAIKAGCPLPEFNLSDAHGNEVTRTGLLFESDGPLLVTFYRGEWCPYCQLELAALQRRLDEFRARNVTLVAISPELPDTSLTTIKRYDLEFPVLSDVGGKFAESLGILWEEPEAMRSLYTKFDLDLQARTGSNELKFPIPATLLVDRRGIVRNTFIETDYSKRLEPSVALEWIDALKRRESEQAQAK